jgi:hypothetical protein
MNWKDAWLMIILLSVMAGLPCAGFAGESEPLTHQDVAPPCFVYQPTINVGEFGALGRIVDAKPWVNGGVVYEFASQSAWKPGSGIVLKKRSTVWRPLSPPSIS